MLEEIVQRNKIIKQEYESGLSVKQIAVSRNLSHLHVWQILNKQGVKTEGHGRVWTKEDDEKVISFYKKGFKAGDGSLERFAAEMGRGKCLISLKASKLGLASSSRGFCDRIKQDRSKNLSDRIKKNGHPKPFLGKKHTPQALLKVGRASKRAWRNRTPQENAAMTLKSLKTRWKKGTLMTPRKNSSWKQSWQEVGGNRIFFRSSWEFEYAKILEKRKSLGLFAKWEHEPDIFWFEEIKRGVRSYCPDFKITYPDGSFEYHEIKGWMDARSITKIKRMAKYYPEIKLKIIEGKEYKALVKNGI
jgi:hypothetical protein